MSEKPALKLVQDNEAKKGPTPRLLEGELWTSFRKQMHSMHYVVSYRGSFKPELPDFCIQRFSKVGDVVLDPFCGRGTTSVQANLLNRVSFSSDINPLAVLITKAKLFPATLDEIVIRMNLIPLWKPVDLKDYQQHFSAFYHPDTYRELLNLRSFIASNPDRINRFIELLALSRLHGHSSSFFSTYSFPQISVPPKTQELINKKRRQELEYRAVTPRIIKRASQVLRDGISSDCVSIASKNKVSLSDAKNMRWIENDFVDLIVTEAPYIESVSGLTDYWLEFWFAGINLKRFSSSFKFYKNKKELEELFISFLRESLRVLKVGGFLVLKVLEDMVDENTNSFIKMVDKLIKVEKGYGKKFFIDELIVNKQSIGNPSSINPKKTREVDNLLVLKCISS